jgi:ABC-type multidrug transport system fused ATPase/permease subunit
METKHKENIRTSFGDLEELVKLASEVSDHIKNIDEKLFKLRVHQLVSILFMYLTLGGMVYMNIDYSMRHLSDALRIGAQVALVLILIISSLNFFIRMQERKRIRGEIETETRVLNKLMDMIYSIKETQSKEEIGVIQDAILEMKINRIKFSPRNKKLEKIA